MSTHRMIRRSYRGQIGALALVLSLGLVGGPLWASEGPAPAAAPKRPGLMHTVKVGAKWGVYAYAGFKLTNWGIGYLNGKRPVFNMPGRGLLGATTFAGILGLGSIGVMPELGFFRAVALSGLASTFGASLVNQSAFLLTERKHKLGREFGIAASMGIPLALWMLPTGLPWQAAPGVGLGMGVIGSKILNGMFKPVWNATGQHVVETVAPRKSVFTKISEKFGHKKDA